MASRLFITQKAKNKNKQFIHCTWREIVFGVTQGPILGPVLFIIFLADLFSTINSVATANYTEHNKPYATANDIDSLTASLDKVFFYGLGNNLIKSNADKCHLLVSSNEKVKTKIGHHEIATSKNVKSF